MVDPLFISVTAEVRDLARSVVQGDFTDPEIQEEQKAAYAKIANRLHKWDWFEIPAAGGDHRFPAVQKIEQQLAAAYIIEYYGSGSPDELAMIKSLRDDANTSLQEQVDETTDPTVDEELIILNSAYESYPASLQDDPNASPYRSTNASVV